MTLPIHYISPLHCALNALERRLKSFPPDLRIIERAKDIVKHYPEELIPTWVKLIADSADNAPLQGVVDLALYDMASETNEVGNAS
jgi:hypothetical protein